MRCTSTSPSPPPLFGGKKVHFRRRRIIVFPLESRQYTNHLPYYVEQVVDKKMMVVVALGLEWQPNCT